MLCSAQALEACRQVLNDVVYCLRDYEDRFYLIGGWAVYYLLDRPDRKPEAIGFAGTEDVDLAFLVPMPELKVIMGSLEAKGYERVTDQRMQRKVSDRTVIVDLLGGKQEIKDRFNFRKRISGPTIEGGIVDAEISVANLAACVTLKAQAFDENPKDKDAYDIYYLITHGGEKDGDAAREVKKVLGHPFIAQGMKSLHVHFGRVEGRGLRAVMRMMNLLEARSPKETRAMVRGSFGRFFGGIGMAVNY